MKDRNVKLKARVEKAREELDSIGIKQARYYFSLKYQEYIGGANMVEKTSKADRLKNLWYCRVFDEDFTKKLEAFLIFKKTQYNKNK